jgi:hypothetical protein
MKVIVTNVTGSSVREALLDKDSGVLEFKDGEISHVLYEKQMNKSIHVVKDAPKVEPRPEEPAPASEEQSKPVKAKKVKAQ